MAALATASLAFVETGDHVLVSEGLYGGTTELVRTLLVRLGIEVTFAPAWQTDRFAAAIRERTRVAIIETLTNPLLRVADLPALGALGRERRVAIIVDSTFATPILCRPLEHGATVVMHSATKYIGGHDDVSLGVCVGSREVVT